MTETKKYLKIPITEALDQMIEQGLCGPHVVLISSFPDKNKENDFTVSITSTLNVEKAYQLALSATAQLANLREGNRRETEQANKEGRH